jgi:hypothetical protein
LATGGFGGDPELRAEHIHPLARDLPLRANPHSTGDGLRLGLSAGAAFGRPKAGFYGHLVPARVPTREPHELAEGTFYHSEHGVLVNVHGERFVDETIADHLNTLAVLDQPEARALLICDQRVHDEWMMKPYVEGVEPVDRFALAYKRGGRCAVADDLEEFEHLPEEWGFDGPAVRRTLEQFNAQCDAVLRRRADTGDHFHLQRAADRRRRARAGRGGAFHPGAARGRRRHRRPLGARVRRRGVDGAGVRAAGRGNRVPG